MELMTKESRNKAQLIMVVYVAGSTPLRGLYMGIQKFDAYDKYVSVFEEEGAYCAIWNSKAIELYTGRYRPTNKRSNFI
jgi:hypothetical protein